MKFRNLSAVIAAATIALTAAGCSSAANNEIDKDETDVTEQLPQGGQPENYPEELPSEEVPPAEQPDNSAQPETPAQPPAAEPPESQPPATEPPESQPPAAEPPESQPPAAEPPESQPPVVTVPSIKMVSYIKVTADNVNIRSGAGTSYSVMGTAEKSTLYACLGESNGFYKTKYKNNTVYISKKYCVVVDMEKSDNDKIENVIAEGAKLLGTPYVYGAVRLHDGKGNMCRGFTVGEFDCSSLMQYIFYKGADKLLQVNTRTQIYQGTTVSKSDLQRGDLIFFTNASRVNNSGVERVGHVALYLGDNYILHTASDYAKIEQISALRWSYYIQTQRMI